METIVQKTAKRQDEIVLPAKQTYLIQPNHVTNAGYNFTLLQEKVMTHLVYSFQNEMNQILNNGQIAEQLALFPTNSEAYSLKFKLSKLGVRPSNYADAKESIMELSKKNIRFQYTKANGEKVLYGGSLISAEVNIAKGSGDIKIHILKPVLEALLTLERAKNGALTYTRYLYEIAMHAKCMYTPRLYKLISSWKKTGGFVISFEELRDRLDLNNVPTKRKINGKDAVVNEDLYTEYKEFKRWILTPVHKELYRKADCWFNFGEKDFEIREGRKVVKLNFKVITPEFEKSQTLLKDQNRNFLKMYFGFTETNFKAVNALLEDEGIRTALTNKIIDLHLFFQTEKSHGIKSKSAYVIKSLINHFQSAS